MNFLNTVLSSLHGGIDFVSPSSLTKTTLISYDFKSSLSLMFIKGVGKEQIVTNDSDAVEVKPDIAHRDAG